MALSTKIKLYYSIKNHKELSKLMARSTKIKLYYSIKKSQRIIQNYGSFYKDITLL